MNIERIYNWVVTGCEYDFEAASKYNMEMISSGVKASDLPHINVPKIPGTKWTILLLILHVIKYNHNESTYLLKKNLASS